MIQHNENIHILFVYTLHDSIITVVGKARCYYCDNTVIIFIAISDIYKSIQVLWNNIESCYRNILIKWRRHVFKMDLTPIFDR